MTAPPHDARPNHADGWRMTHPLALVGGIVNNAKGTISLVLSFIVIVRASLRHGDTWLWLLAAVILAYVLVGPVARWLSTRYRLTGTALEYRSGVLFRKHRTIAYGSIHAVNSARPWYLQPFGVIRLNVSPVGTNADIVLDAVPAALQSELEARRVDGSDTVLKARLLDRGVNVGVDEPVEREVSGIGNGPIAAFLNAISNFGVDASIMDYVEHTMSVGTNAMAASYVECQVGEADDAQIVWGVGIDSSITTSALKAIISAVNRSNRAR